MLTRPPPPLLPHPALLLSKSNGAATHNESKNVVYRSRHSLSRHTRVQCDVLLFLSFLALLFAFHSQWAWRRAQGTIMKPTPQPLPQLPKPEKAASVPPPPPHQATHRCVFFLSL